MLLLLLILHLVLSLALHHHHHHHHSRCHHHPLIGIAECCVSLLLSHHCSLCSHLPSMSCHCLHNCPHLLFVVVTLPRVSTIIASHLPSPPSMPLPPLSSSPLYHILLYCYVVICCLSSIVHCPSSIVLCQLSIVSHLQSCCLPICHFFLLEIFATTGLKG